VADVVSGADPVPQVLSEIQSGEGLSLSAAGRLFPGHRRNGTVDPSTVFRWVTKGMRTPDGRVVRLEAVRVGGRWLTSRGAVARFVSALTAAADPPPATSTPAPRTPAARQKASEAAARELARRGA
jgi:hypothetical protein